MSRKKSSKAEKAQAPKQAGGCPPPVFGRIELQAAPEWIKELDAMASAMGMSRSAYIRMACNLKMAADRKALSGGGPPS